MAVKDTTQGRTLSRYRLLEEVGQGGMAVVYRGFDTTLHREVAVKVLHPHLAGMAESRARLQREAHAVAKLRHENILEIFDYSGPDSSESFIVTEFIHGKTLKTLLGDQGLPFPEVAEMVASEVARALEHAHSLGVIHRDIKPENVMIRDDGLVKLMDFGIAQIIDKERMTVTGQLLGSPAYMAPEHVEGKPLDFRTDVFAVGILLYQLATGQLPFRGKNPHEVLKRIAECKYTPPELTNRRIGARLSRVIGKALQREPGARYSDVALLRAELLSDLADADIDDPRRELQRFFAGPEAWCQAFGPRLVDALARRGKELSQKGRTAAALELWSRALAVEPKSPELRALVQGLARRQRFGKLAAFAGAALVAAGALTLGARSWRHRPHAAAPPPLLVHTAKGEPKLAAPLPPVAKEPEKTVAKEHRPAPLSAPHKKPPPAAETPKRLIEIAATPPAVQVFIDGADQGMITDGKYQVTDGKHVVRLQNQLCFALELDVDTAQKQLYSAHLMWKPAKLTIKATPENADVVVGKTVVTAGQPVNVPIGSESEDGRREVPVRVSAPGHRPQELLVQVRATDEIAREVALVRLESE